MNAAEAALIEDVEVIPVESLHQLVMHLIGDSIIAPYAANGTNRSPSFRRRLPRRYYARPE